MLKKILIAVAAVLVALLVLIATRPATYRVERSVTVAAPAAVAFPYANDFKRFITWSPWQKLDPALETTFSGPKEGTGSVYEWQGNEDVGEGRMTIVESAPTEHVKYKLEFIKPFASVAATTISFAPEAGGTKVTWAMEGENSFVSKAFSLFMNMDQMIGKDFEAGLSNLKTLAEAEAKKVP